MTKKEIKEKLNIILEDSYIYDGANELNEERFMEVLQKELPELYSELYNIGYSDGIEYEASMNEGDWYDG